VTLEQEKRRNNMTLSYEQWAAKYLNQRNPATGMYWTMQDTVSDSGLSEDMIQGYSARARGEHIQAMPQEVAAGIPSASIESQKQSTWYQNLLNQGVDPMQAVYGTQSAPASAVPPPADKLTVNDLIRGVSGETSGGRVSGATSSTSQAQPMRPATTVREPPSATPQNSTSTNQQSGGRITTGGESTSNPSQQQSYTMDQLRGMTDAERLKYWSTIPGMENVKNQTYFDESGQPYRYIGEGYWQDANTGKWYKGYAQGEKAGQIELVGDKPPWESAPKQKTFSDILREYLFGTADSSGNLTGGKLNDPYYYQRTMLNNQIASLQQGRAQAEASGATAEQLAQIDADIQNAQNTLGNLPPVPTAKSILSGANYQPGELTLQALLNMPEYQSWAKPGAWLGQGYGQAGYGGQNLVSNPYYQIPKK
jgi:hypothetical protein